MMKYLLLALAVTAISAQFEDEATLVDDLLAEEASLPCTPKPCVPVCKPVTKYLSFGSFKIPYTENVCQPDHACLAAAAACVKKLQAAMVDADKKAKALEAASKAKNAAHASKAAKDKAAAQKKAEAASAKNALGLAKASFEAAEKEAANAKAAKESATKLYAAKAATMDARLKTYEKAKQSHLKAVAAYDGAKSAAAKAAAAYDAAVKAHCDAEAQHAAAVKNIGHGHLAQKNCAKYNTPKYAYSKLGSNSCPRGCSPINDLKTCKDSLAWGKAQNPKAATLGGNTRGSGRGGNYGTGRPGGCFLHNPNKHIHFNTNKVGGTRYRNDYKICSC